MLTVSIVMPSHNRKERLLRVLEALTKQTYPQNLVEVVLVLDGCVDGSAEAVREKIASYPFALKIIEQKQGGPAAARNAGVNNASNEFILFLDDDVIPADNLIATHMQQHEPDDRVVVVGTMTTPSNHERPVWVKWERYILEAQYHDMITGKYAPTARQFYTGNASLAAKWLRRAGGFDESFKRAEDIELAYRLKDMGLRFHFNPQAIGYHYANRTYKLRGKKLTIFMVAMI